MRVQEPPTNNPLLSMDNVITFDMGAASLESEHRSQVIIGDCIADFFAGNVPYNVKNKLEK